VIERHGDAEAVTGAQAHARAHEVGVVENIAMRQRGTLGQPRRTAGELYVDGIRRTELGGDGLPLPMPLVGGLPADLVEGEPPRTRLGPDLDDGHEVWQPRQRQGTGRTGGNLRCELFDHGNVVTRFEARRRDQCLHTHLVSVYSSSAVR